MGLFVIEKNGKKIVGGKNKFVVDYKDLPEEIREEDRIREQQIQEQQIQEQQQELIHEKPVIYEPPKKRSFKRKEKVVTPKEEVKKEEPVKKVEKKKIEDKTSSLDNYVSNDRNYLNNIAFANAEVKEVEEDTSLYDGNKLKTESTIIGIAFKTILISYLIFILVSGLVLIAYFVLRKFDVLNVELFRLRDYYTVREFNNNNMRTMGILAIYTTFFSLLALVAIRTSISMGLKKKYLNKVNIYIYDVFIVLMNVLFFILIILAFFNLIDNLHEQFALLVELKKIDGPVNIEAIVHFKMFVVIIASMVLTISSYFGVELIHKKNKFIFDDSVF